MTTPMPCTYYRYYVNTHCVIGSFVVKLYNINDVDTYDMASVTLFSKCEHLNLSSQQAMLYTITSNVPDSSTEIICGSTNGCTFGR